MSRDDVVLYDLDGSHFISMAVRNARLEVLSCRRRGNAVCGEVKAWRICFNRENNVDLSEDHKC